MLTLAQIADPHVSPLPRPSLIELCGKRLLGYLSWQLRRKHIHEPQVLESLTIDLIEAKPDHVAVVGDLTNIALRREFPLALEWLRRLGDPNDVSVIPGNHDTYVEQAWQDTVGRWRDYMHGDSCTPDGRAIPNHGWSYPWTRIRSDVAVIGVSTAIATRPLMATGEVGRQQLGRLETLLIRLRELGLFRVLLIHHPPLDELTKHRKRLIDSGEFAKVIARAGAELVLHGHTHCSTFARMPGADGTVPVVASASASANGSNGEQLRATYNLFRIEKTRRGWTNEMEVRALGTDGRFTTQQKRTLISV